MPTIITCFIVTVRAPWWAGAEQWFVEEMSLSQINKLAN